MEKLDVVAIVQARMGSTRFPGKVLEKLYQEETVLEVVCKRANLSSVVDRVIVATTTNPKDDEIVELCEEKEIEYFRGSEEDVARRVYEAADNAAADIIVDITADCPFIDDRQITEMVQTLIEENLEYCSNVMKRTWADGLDIQVYTKNAYMRLLNNRACINREHSGYNFILHQKLFKCKNFKAPAKYFRPHWELTLDHPEDLLLLRILADWGNSLGKDSSTIYFGLEFNTHEILDILNNHPVLLFINSGIGRHEISNASADNLIEKG